MRQSACLVALLTLLLSACATRETPQLGRIDNSRYYDAAKRFACPVPGAALGFTGPVRIADAEAGGEGFISAPRVEFIDTQQPGRRITIEFVSVRQGTDFRSAGFDAQGFGRISIGSTSLHQLTLHYAMMQFPYRQEEAIQPVELHLLANFSIPLKEEAGARLVQLRDVHAAAPLLPSHVDVTDSERTLHALRRESGALRELRNSTFDWLRECYWSNEALPE